MGCCAARDLQSGIVEAKSSTAKADTSGTGFGVSPVTVADFTVQCLLLGALAQRFPNERSTVPLAILAVAGPATFRLEALSRLRTRRLPQPRKQSYGRYGRLGPAVQPWGCLSEAPAESPALAACLVPQDPNPRVPDPNPGVPDPNPSPDPPAGA